MNAPTTRFTLYSGPLSMFGAKTQIAALEKGLNFKLVMVDYESARGYEPRHPEVLRINPKRQVPVLVHGTLEIFDSTQIFEYLEDLQPAPPLWPRTPQARARARLLEHKSDEVYFPHVIKLFDLQDDLHSATAQAALGAAAAYHEEMEKLLANSEWLAGDFSYADIAFFMAALFAERHNALITPATPRLLAWRTRMLERASVRQVAGAMGRWLRAAGRPVPAFLQPAL